MSNTAENIYTNDFDRVLRINANTEQVTQEELDKLRQYLDYDTVFNRDYTWGYTSALLDILSLFESGKMQDICSGLKLTKNFKTIQKFLKAILNDKETFKNNIQSQDLYFGYDPKTDKIFFKVGK